jgi:hypothetical protein
VLYDLKKEIESKYQYTQSNPCKISHCSLVWAFYQTHSMQYTHFLFIAVDAGELIGYLLQVTNCRVHFIVTVEEKKKFDL